MPVGAVAEGLGTRDWELGVCDGFFLGSRKMLPKTIMSKAPLPSHTAGLLRREEEEEEGEDGEIGGAGGDEEMRGGVGVVVCGSIVIVECVQGHLPLS